MKKIIKKIPLVFGFYNKLKERKLFVKFRKLFQTFKDLSQGKERFSLLWEDKYPCLNENTKKTKFDAHYIYHPAWAARILAQTKPEKHTDISSTLHFCTIISAFIPTEFYDFRPAQLNLNNLISKKADLTNLPFKDGSIRSLSCMHTVEHIGLGRYGDELDPDGDLKAMSELQRVLAKDGSLLFVVPIGQPKIMFNAHRIYSFDQIKEYFKDLKLEDFSLIIDDGNFIQKSDKETADRQKYGCGCFWFKK